MTTSERAENATQAVDGGYLFWMTLREEIRYQWSQVWLFPVIVTAVALAGRIFTDNWTPYAVGACFITFIIGAITIGDRMEKDKRDRLMRRLPMSQPGYAFIRLIVFPLYMLMLLLVFAVVQLILPSEITFGFIELAQLLGMMITVTMLIAVNEDIRWVYGWPGCYALWLVIVAYVAYAIYQGGGSLTFNLSPDDPDTFIKALWLNLAWPLFMVVDMWLYLRRSSYTK